MTIFYKHTMLTVCAITCLFSPTNVTAQFAPPDAYSRNQEKIIDSLVSRKLARSVDSTTNQRNIKKAASIYLELSKNHLIQDPIGFLYYSVAAQSPEGFYVACKELIRVSADSVNEIIENEANMWGENDMTVLKKEPLASAIKRLKKEQGKLIQNAKVNLDWKWNADLKAISKSNIEFRSIDVSYFKDSASWYEAMIQFDSTHLTEICNLVAERGFPYYNKVGRNASYIRVPLIHATALLYFKDNPKRADYFIEKFKFLMPFLHYAVTTGQFDEGFYNRLTKEWIPEYLKKGNRTEDIIFFRKFEL